jgi:hypothetical protein
MGTTHLDPDVKPAFEQLLNLCKDYNNTRESQREQHQREVERLWTDDRFGSIIKRSWPNGPKLSHTLKEEDASSEVDSVSSE